MLSSLNQIAEAAHANSWGHGFWGGAPLAEEPLREYLGNKLMLIVGEVAEAHEELRKLNHEIGVPYYSYPPVPASFAVEFPSGGDATEAWQATQTPKPDGLPAELADIILRVGDLAGRLGIDLEVAVAEKHAYNTSREHKHGKAF